MIKKFEVPIFQGMIRVVVKPTVTQGLEAINCTIDSCEDNTNGMCISFGSGKNLTIILREDVKISTIAHESYHAMNKIYSELGHTIDQENDEVGAYLLGWITQKVYDIWAAAIKKRDGL